MSLKNAKKVDTNRYELEVVIDGEKFREALSGVMRRESKKLLYPVSVRVKRQSALLKSITVLKPSLRKP